MDKRNWPWRKKEPYDDKIRRLNNKLLAADNLAKQHANVAEEAVSGWEKTKTDNISMKCQLDLALEQRQAAEVRLLHLDGALKECMLQLRQEREEQEQTIHEAIMKRSREWDTLRLELEERLAAVQRHAKDLDSQRNALCVTAQEQSEAVTKLDRIRSEAETEIKSLQAEVQALEKKNASLKYEIIVLNKELAIRNKELEMNTRSVELATQQHLESRKTIAKLESDCKRLQTLVRKKLPGPGALRQMKLEAGMGVEGRDASNKQRPKIKAPASPQATVKLPGKEDPAGMSIKSPKLAPMSPESRMTDSFRENLMSEDGYDDDRSLISSWASSPVVDASLLRGKGRSLHHSGRAIDRLDSINDFLEIERLVSLPPENAGMEPITKAGQSLPSMSEKVLSNGAELETAFRPISEIGRTSLIFNRSGDAACGLRGPHSQKGPHVMDCTSEFTTLVCKVIHIVEGLALNIMADFKDRPPNDDINAHNETFKVKRLLSELEASLKHFNAAGDAYLYGKAELTPFMSELYSILEELNTGPKAYRPLSSKMRWRLGVQLAEQEIISDVGSPILSSSNSARSDSLTRKDSSSDEAGKVQVGRQTSEIHTREELLRGTKVEHGTMELKQENSDLKTKLQEARSKVDLMKAKLEDSEQLVASLRNRLTSAELSGMVAEKSLTSVTAAKELLELRLQDSLHEVGRLREKVKDLELCNEQEKRRNAELEAEAKESRTLRMVVASNSHDALEKSIKDQEIADATEKLAQCQRTIFVLGQQLKDIAKAKDGNLVVASGHEVQDDQIRGYVLKLDDTTHPPMDTFASTTDPEASSICGFRTDVFAGLPKVAKSALPEEEFNLPFTMSPVRGYKALTETIDDAKQQMVLSVPKPASKKKAYAYSFSAAAMRKSLDLEPSSSPHRKPANRFSKFFASIKNSST